MGDGDDEEGEEGSSRVGDNIPLGMILSVADAEANSCNNKGQLERYNNHANRMRSTCVP